ncbi:XdhC family protein [Thiohalorhabdus sp. Cl-TMA]|uniref:XdhC family protein n=1 Tax=Thiohalorhabdus methylotrophus TaxID=3242694 RepID=A0ABV4TTN6_9GAMM
MSNGDSVLERARSLEAAGLPGALATVVRVYSPTSGKPGDKAVVDGEGRLHGWIGGGCAQPAVIRAARQAMADSESRLIRIRPEEAGAEEAPESGVEDVAMRCHSGGTLEIFIEPLTVAPGLLVLGGSPAAHTLAALAGRVGFTVTVAAKGAGASVFPEASEVVPSLRLERRPAGRPLLAVVATQGQGDELGLETALSLGADHIAFIASARKAEQLRTDLKERGFDAGAVDAIEAPAGVPLDARNPREIAVSVLAGLVNARHRLGAGAVLEPEPAPAPAAEVVDPICGMTVDPATADFSTEYGGRTWYFCCGHCQHRFEQDPAAYADAGAPA